MKSKNTLFIILFFFLTGQLFAQPLMEIPSKEIKDIVNKGDDCLAQKGDNCFEYYKQAIALGEKRDVDYVDYLHYILAYGYSLADNSDAVLDIIAEQYPEAKNGIVRAGFLNLKASIFYKQNMTDSAVHYFVQVAEILEKENELQKTALTYLNIGNILYTQHSINRSTEYLLKSNDILKEINDTMFLCLTAAHISENYAKLNDYEKTIQWANEAIAHPIKSDIDRKGHLLAYRALATLYLSSNVDSAAFLIKRVVEMAEQLGDDNELGSSYQQLAETLLKQGKKTEALIASEKAIAYNRKLNFGLGLTENLFVAGKVSKELGLYQKAADYFYEAKILSDSVKSEKSIQVINELNTKYETEKKERQLAQSELLIQQKNAQIRNWILLGILIIGGLLTYFYQFRRTQRSKLKLLEKEKENEILSARVLGEEIERGRISKELHDGVASSLLVTRLQMEKNTEEAQANAIQLIKNAHKEIRNIAHKLNPIDFSKNNWVEEIKTFCDNIYSEKTKVHFFSNVIDVNINATHQLILFRAVQELLQNAVKHAGAKNISVQIVEENGNINISIEDDGKGAQKSLINEAKSLGNLKERLRNINVELHIDSEPNAGTAAFISYK